MIPKKSTKSVRPNPLFLCWFALQLVQLALQQNNLKRTLDITEVTGGFFFFFLARKKKVKILFFFLFSFFPFSYSPFPFFLLFRFVEERLLFQTNLLTSVYI